MLDFYVVPLLRKRPIKCRQGLLRIGALRHLQRTALHHYSDDKRFLSGKDQRHSSLQLPSAAGGLSAATWDATAAAAAGNDFSLRGCLVLHCFMRLASDLKVS